MRQQPARHRRRRLTFLGGALADLLAVKDAALEVDERAAMFLVGRCGRDRAGPGTGIDSDQDEPRHMTQRPLGRKDRTAFYDDGMWKSMLALLLSYQ
jgi:hypothetical protein